LSKFTLRMMGEEGMRGQNGMARNFRPVVQIACKKKQKKAQRGEKRR
jgi:hypothetical protein